MYLWGLVSLTSSELNGDLRSPLPLLFNVFPLSPLKINLRAHISRLKTSTAERPKLRGMKFSKDFFIHIGVSRIVT